MQLVLQGTGKPTPAHFFSAKVLLNAWIQYHGVFLDERDIEVKYNDCYDFWDVTVYRSCIAGPGHGSPEYRDQNWIKQKEIINSLLNHSVLALALHAVCLIMIAIEALN